MKLENQEELQKFLGILLIALGATLILLYPVGSFIAWDFRCGYWPMWLRVAVGILYLVITGWVVWSNLPDGDDDIYMIQGKDGNRRQLTKEEAAIFRKPAPLTEEEIVELLGDLD